jgi:hypothetical protein
VLSWRTAYSAKFATVANSGCSLKGLSKVVRQWYVMWQCYNIPTHLQVWQTKLQFLHDAEQI